MHYRDLLCVQRKGPLNNTQSQQGSQGWQQECKRGVQEQEGKTVQWRLQTLWKARPYSLKQGIAKFGEAAKQAAMKEMKQLHDRECFMPIDPKTMNITEKKRVIESLIFLKEKKDGLIKGRHCANGNPQRQWMD